MNSLYDLTLKCVRCGFCLESCPTFHITGNEADSPRGRIHLIRSMMEHTQPFDDGLLAHIDACLGCRACEPACPSGVEYGHILEQFRAMVESQSMRPTQQSSIRRQLIDTMTTPKKLGMISQISGFIRQTSNKFDELPSTASELLTGDKRATVMMPNIISAKRGNRLIEYNPAEGVKRHTVAMLEGCAMRVLYQEINRATVRVLQKNGCDVYCPSNAQCCGALDLHAGFKDEARRKARALIDVIEKYNIDAFVVNSAGCGSTLKEYDKLLEDDPVYADRASKLAIQTRDVCEYLAEIGMRQPEKSIDRVVAYHDACHLKHAQGIADEPRMLLQSIRGLKLVPLQDADECCGSAGIYNVTQPVMARELLLRKVERIKASGADCVAAGNPGCMAWIAKGLQQLNCDIKVVHPIELLNQAYDD